MSDLKRWRVTGPDGFEKLVEAPDKESAVVAVWRCVPWLKLMHLAGYRAEPVEEPKMVTVRAEDVRHLWEVCSGARIPGALTSEIGRRLRAALEEGK